MVGTLYGSTLADKHSPQRIVALGFLVGALAMGAIGMIASTIDVPAVAKAGEVQQLANVGGIVVALLLLTIAITGLGTSGTQTLIYGLAANYCRTSVRGAGMLVLGPEPLIGPQQVTLGQSTHPERSLRVATDGLHPFAVSAAP